jgi:hypothetical protein
MGTTGRRKTEDVIYQGENETIFIIFIPHLLWLGVGMHPEGE